MSLRAVNMSLTGCRKGWAEDEIKTIERQSTISCACFDHYLVRHVAINANEPYKVACKYTYYGYNKTKYKHERMCTRTWLMDVI